jgi:hypothetical protein
MRPSSVTLRQILTCFAQSTVSNSSRLIRSRGDGNENANIPEHPHIDLGYAITSHILLLSRLFPM